MSDLVMEIGALQGAAQHIRAASAVADQVHSHGSTLEGQASAAGQSDAASGLSDFVDRWGYGAGHLHTDAEELAKALEQVITALQQVDRELANAAKGHR